jgi:hypothetical protein
LTFTDDDFRLYTSDGSSWVKSPSTGGYGVTSTSDKVYTVDMTSKLTTMNNGIKKASILVPYTTDL